MRSVLSLSPASPRAGACARGCSRESLRGCALSGTLCRLCHLGRLFCRLRQWDFVPSGAFSWVASPVYRREWWMVRQGGEEQPALQKGTAGVDVSFVCDMSRAPHAWGTPLVGEEQKVWRSCWCQDAWERNGSLMCLRMLSAAVLVLVCVKNVTRCVRVLPWGDVVFFLALLRVGV